MVFFDVQPTAQSLIFFKSFKDLSRQRSQDHTGQVWNGSGVSSRGVNSFTTAQNMKKGKKRQKMQILRDLLHRPLRLKYYEKNRVR